MKSLATVAEAFPFFGLEPEHIEESPRLYRAGCSAYGLGCRGGGPGGAAEDCRRPIENSRTLPRTGQSENPSKRACELSE
jgi:hypothetical protein